MISGKYEYQSDFARKHQALGRAEGRAEGEARSVLRVLAARGVPVTEEHQARILACTDVAVLERWITRAVSITNADELFEQ